MNRHKQLAIWIGILSFAFSLTLYAQGEQSEIPQGAVDAALLYGGPPDPEELALSKVGLSGLGLTFINGDPLFRLQLQPDIDLGKVGFGLDVVLLYNFSADEGEDTFLAEDGETWDDISTILRVVRYVRYGNLGEPFYTRLGELDYVTIGHGFIMSGYSNYDRRGLRLNLSTKTKKVGVETVINNLGDPTVFGGRVFVRPLQKEEGGTPILNRLEFGATYLTDIEPNLIPDEKGKPETTDEDPLIALGADVGIPLINNKLLRVDLYDDVAFLNTKPKEGEPGKTEIAIGNAVGLGLSISKALFKVEYRNFGEGFQPTIFDYTYDSAKGVGPDFFGMDEDGDAGEAKQGYFSLLAWRPVSKVDFLATFEDYTTTEPKLYAGITESGLVNRLSFRAFYVKRNIGARDRDGTERDFLEDLFRLDDKSAFTVRIGYELIPKLEIAIIREYRFQQVEEDGEIVFKPIQKTSVEAGFRLDF